MSLVIPEILLKKPQIRASRILRAEIENVHPFARGVLGMMS